MKTGARLGVIKDGLIGVERIQGLRYLTLRVILDFLSFESSYIALLSSEEC
jgi:hypothetical protein